MAPISRVAGLCNSLSRCITDAVKFAGDDRRFVKQDRRPVILLTHPTLSGFDLQDTQLARTQPPLRTPSSLRGSHYMLRHSVAAAGDAAAIRRRMRRFAQRHPTATSPYRAQSTVANHQLQVRRSSFMQSALPATAQPQHRYSRRPSPPATAPATQPTAMRTQVIISTPSPRAPSPSQATTPPRAAAKRSTSSAPVAILGLAPAPITPRWR